MCYISWVISFLTEHAVMVQVQKQRLGRLSLTQRSQSSFQPGNHDSSWCCERGVLSFSCTLHWAAALTFVFWGIELKWSTQNTGSQQGLLLKPGSRGSHSLLSHFRGMTVWIQGEDRNWTLKTNELEKLEQGWVNSWISSNLSISYWKWHFHRRD